MQVTYNCTYTGNVFLESTRDGLPIYPGQTIAYTCETRGSSIIGWSSDAYIGRGTQLEFVTLNSPGSTLLSQSIPTTIATLVSVRTQNGTVVLISTLRVITSSNFSDASVTCHNVGLDTRNTTTIQLTGTHLHVNIINLSYQMQDPMGWGNNVICPSPADPLALMHYSINKKMLFLPFSPSST